VSWLFVIARNSSFVFRDEKGGCPDDRQCSRSALSGGRQCPSGRRPAPHQRSAR
jgi:hypothetical protein